MSLIPVKQRNTKANVLIDIILREIAALYENGMSLTKIGKKLSIDRKAFSSIKK